MNFSTLYNKLLKAELLHQKPSIDEAGAEQLSCLLEPQKHPVVIKTEDCRGECKGECRAACVFNAIENKDGKLVINKGLCVGCNECIKVCKENKIVPSVDIIAAIKEINSGRPSYALIAPAIVGQFDGAAMGQIRNALKKLGFTGVIEVSLFADILTLKEGVEFKNHIKQTDDYMLTSCCCPIWIALIKKHYNLLSSHLAPSVSPMIAAGRFVKSINKNCTTVFIGPCIAKKAEIREPDLIGAIDYCITFSELNDAFNILGIEPKNQADEKKEHSSKMGRLYSVSGGVTTAVKNTVKHLEYKNKIPLTAARAEGVINLKNMLNEVIAGKTKANFYEGMGCVGGCVGGPKILLDKHLGRAKAVKYAKLSSYKTPLNNPFVIELLERLNITDEETLLNCEILKRKL